MFSHQLFKQPYLNNNFHLYLALHESLTNEVLCTTMIACIVRNMHKELTQTDKASAEKLTLYNYLLPNQISMLKDAQHKTDEILSFLPPSMNDRFRVCYPEKAAFIEAALANRENPRATMSKSLSL